MLFRDKRDRDTKGAETNHGALTLTLLGGHKIFFLIASCPT